MEMGGAMLSSMLVRAVAGGSVVKKQLHTKKVDSSPHAFKHAA
jgi:hypothetical protein